MFSSSPWRGTSHSLAWFPGKGGSQGDRGWHVAKGSLGLVVTQSHRYRGCRMGFLTRGFVSNVQQNLDKAQETMRPYNMVSSLDLRGFLLLRVTPLDNADLIGLFPSVMHKEIENKTKWKFPGLLVLEWLTWAPEGDGGRGWTTRDHRQHVFHNMQLTISRVDEENRAGMMITAACKPPTSGQRE